MFDDLLGGGSDSDSEEEVKPVKKKEEIQVTEAILLEHLLPSLNQRGHAPMCKILIKETQNFVKDLKTSFKQEIAVVWIKDLLLQNNVTPEDVN